MLNNTFAPLVILALNTETDVETEKAILEQAGFEYPRPVDGVYKGEKEQAWLLGINTVESALSVARDHGQESILFLDNQRNGWLIYCADERRELLGEFHEVSQSVAISRDSYTISDGRYFVCGY